MVLGDVKGGIVESELNLTAPLRLARAVPLDSRNIANSDHLFKFISVHNGTVPRVS